jgi:hypothetical protein
VPGRSRAAIAVPSSGAVHGSDPRPHFRFPYGDLDTRTIRAVNAAGYLPVRCAPAPTAS